MVLLDMMKNKTTLAKLLSEEDIFVVHKKMETAYFNSKTRELGLPIWKDEEMTPAIYDLMVGHEIGHALWTPLDMLEDAAVRKIDHSFVNILEDARIEKFVKRKYAGMVGVFKRGYNELVVKDFFGTNGKDVNSFNLIDRINLFFKGNSDVTFSDEEKVWVDRAASTETPAEVLDLAEELYKWMEENESETDNHNSGEEGEEGDSSDENGGASDENGGASGEDGDEETGEGKPSAGDEKGEEDGNDAPAGGVGDDGNDDADGDAKVEEGESSEVGGKNSSGSGSVPKATTDASTKAGMDALLDKSANDRSYGRIPKVNLSEIILSYKEVIEEFDVAWNEGKKSNGTLFWDETLKELEALRNDNKKTIAYMVKEFEMKKSADAYARAATSKTGSLDMGKLHTYKYNEDLFKKVTTLPGATNHGMVMVVDWSGSMCENLKGTIAQLFNLIWFCRRTKIPFEVFAFSDAYGRDQYGRPLPTPAKNKAFKAGDIALSNFKLLNFFSSNMTLTEENKMMHSLTMTAVRYSRTYRDWKLSGYPYTEPNNMRLGGTPLNDSIIAMMDYVPKFKADSGVQKVNTVFLTDGASNSLAGVWDYHLNTETGEYKEITKTFSNRFARDTISVITDPVTNKSYEFKAEDNVTNELIKILKNRVYDMNVIGFFIAGSGKSGRVDKRTLQYLLGTYDRDIIMEKVKFINKNKYLALDSLGYDEYYVLPGGSSLDVENAGLDDELVGASKAKLKSAFGKSMKGRISSRQLLNKFVKLVA